MWEFAFLVGLVFSGHPLLIALGFVGLLWFLPMLLEGLGSPRKPRQAPQAPQWTASQERLFWSAVYLGVLIIVYMAAVHLGAFAARTFNL